MFDDRTQIAELIGAVIFIESDCALLRFSCFDCILHRLCFGEDLRLNFTKNRVFLQLRVTAVKVQDRLLQSLAPGFNRPNIRDRQDFVDDNVKRAAFPDECRFADSAPEVGVGFPVSIGFKREECQEFSLDIA